MFLKEEGQKLIFFLGMEMNMVQAFVQRLTTGVLGQERTPASLVEVVKGALKDAPDLTLEDREPKAVGECTERVSNEREQNDEGKKLSS